MEIRVNNRVVCHVAVVKLHLFLLIFISKRQHLLFPAEIHQEML